MRRIVVSRAPARQISVAALVRKFIMTLPSFVTFSVLMFLTIIGLVLLGNWQIERREEKHALIGKVEDRIKASPVTLEDVIKRRDGGDDIEYLRVRVVGVFDHAKERYLFATFKGMKGWHVYTPFKLAGGMVVFVNRGFVPDALKSPVTRKEGQVSGVTKVTGLVRKAGRRGYFDADNDVVRNIWYWRDLKHMVASVFSTGGIYVYPFFVEAEASPDGVQWPMGGVTRLAFPDNHFQYALTWYGLAITILAVYGFFLRNWLMQRRSA